ncbi:cytochrome P450 [Rhizophagus irregularis DAOM 181602=DAOM 197198]|nr:cytochrome P450 [Rhizophagus irregularis DAOM 181602=DAOM 197198]
MDDREWLIKDTKCDAALKLNKYYTGRKFAMIELKLLTALIYRKYDVGLLYMNAPLKTKFTAVTTCRELIIC